MIGLICGALCSLLLACGAEQFVPNQDGSATGSNVDGPSLGSGGSNTGSGGDLGPGTGGLGGDAPPNDDAGGVAGSGGIPGSGGTIDAGAGGTPSIDAPMDLGGNDVVDASPEVHAAALMGSTGTAFGGNPTGGGPFQDACPGGQAVIGFSGTVTVANPALGVVNGQIGTRCGVIQILGTTVTVISGAVLPTHGVLEPTLWTRTCPANQVVVGFAGHMGSFLDQLVFNCAPLTAASDAPGAALTPGTATALMPVGGDGGGAFAQITCPAGQIASGSLVRTGDYLDAVSLICSSATIAP
ncbi:MAG TPA: hypothetical protein VH374_07040 [Polyangia bacterium]|nr:hypothetical protein [Polyangia bacterium]